MPREAPGVHSSWRFRHTAKQQKVTHETAPPLEMLKMKIDPAMCMKRKRERQNVMPKMRLFTRKFTNGATIDNHPSGFRAENTPVRDKARR
jgi:hypothetical protein